MRIAHHLLRSRFGVYHFRLKVPADLHAAVGRRIIKISLGTGDARRARVYSYTLSLHYAEAFAALRGAAVPKPPPSIEAILANALAGGTRRFEVDFDPISHRPTRLKTDGTEQDNRAALEALRLLAQTGLPVLPAASRAKLGRNAAKIALKPVGLTLAAAIRLYTESEAPTLKPNTWSQRRRAFESLKTELGGKRLIPTITVNCEYNLRSPRNSWGWNRDVTTRADVYHDSSTLHSFHDLRRVHRTGPAGSRRAAPDEHGTTGRLVALINRGRFASAAWVRGIDLA